MVSLRTSNKSKVYFKIRFLRNLTCLNLDRTVISPILIDLLSSEHSKTSLGHDFFPQLIGISIDSEWSKCVRGVSNFPSICSFSPSTRNFDECRAFKTCWRSRKRLSDMTVPIMDILSNSHIHVSSSFESPPFLSYRNEEGIYVRVTQCIVR
jgi:hypothetical protein